MIAKIKDYEVVPSDISVNVTMEFFEDNGTQTETEDFVIAFDEFTSFNVINRMNDMLRRRIRAKQTPPTEAQLEAILPLGFKTAVPG